MTSKEEYLKRYLSTNANPAKKKKRSVDKARVKILDDDIDVNALIPRNINNTIDEDIGSDKPTVAQFVDERPEHVKELERFRQSKQWKVISQDDEPSHSVPGNIRHRHDTDSDQSAESPVRLCGSNKRTRHDSDFDPSPVRSGNLKSSPAKRQRHDSDSDLSPARATGSPNIVSLAESRPTRHDSSTSHSRSDARKQQTCHDSDSDASPPRLTVRTKRHDSDSDLSPAREATSTNTNRAVRSGANDLSPPRKSASGGHSSDLASSRDRPRSGDGAGRSRDQKQDDKSTTSRLDSHKDGRNARPRARCDSDEDMSPVRKNQATDSSKKSDRQKPEQKELKPERRQRNEDEDGDLSPVRNSDRKATKTLAGAKAGLQMAADMRKEASELRRREKEAFDQISDEMLGRNAKAIQRDKATGRIRNLEEEKAREEAEAAVKALKTAKYDEWSKGIKQKELLNEKINDALHEADKPLARYGDDADLDARLRDVEREGDTMLDYIRRKKSKAGVGKSVAKPLYRGPEPPPNRFGIRPGYRWDGVDRSNGFEKLYYSKLSEKKALKDMAYKWSVEDM